MYLGIDPSKTSCGWAVNDGERTVTSGTASCAHRQTEGVKGIEALYSGRLNLWAFSLGAQLIDRFSPVAMAIEEILTHTPDGAVGKHVSAVIFSGLSAAAVSRNVPVYSVPQGTWRKGVGVKQGGGSNTKAEAMRLCRLFDGAAPRTHDAAEARLIARWLAAQFSSRASHNMLPLMAAAATRGNHG